MGIEKKQDANTMLYLCICAVKGSVPEEKQLQNIDLEALYNVSVFQSVDSLVCEGLELAKKQNSTLFCTEHDKRYLKKFIEARGKSIQKEIMFDMERKKLLAFMEENEIWYAPLKGILLKDMYPKLGLRQMADNDILFDVNGRERVRDWFTEQGYQVSSYKRGHHDVYQKLPFFNFEMHTTLYDASNEAAYENIICR